VEKHTKSWISLKPDVKQNTLVVVVEVVVVVGVVVLVHCSCGIGWCKNVNTQ